MSHNERLALNIGSHVATSRARATPRNTKKAYGPYKSQYLQFCEQVYPHVPMNSPETLVTEEKLFTYLWYTAHREKLPPKGGLRRFDIAHFRKTLADHGVTVDAVNDSEQIPILYDRRYPGKSTFDAASAAIKELLKDACLRQNKDEAPILASLSSARIHKLRAHVVSRKGDMKAKNHEELFDDADHPEAHTQYLGPIEQLFWVTLCQFARDLRTCLTILQFRFFYVYSLQSLSRGACLWNARLPFFHGNFLHRNPSFFVTAMEILRQFSWDKNTNIREGKPVMHSVSRHRDVTRCGHGAFAILMVFRFTITDEAAHFDFLNNDSWFGVRVIVTGDCSHENNKKEARTNEYIKMLKAFCEQLGIRPKKWEHFGRCEMVRLLEMLEVPRHIICALGKWASGDRNARENSNAAAYNQFYSEGMNLEGMRAAAGHSREKTGHYVPRSCVEPSETLQKMLLPWVDSELAKVENTDHSTARSFLKTLRRLRVVFFQDIAAMMIEHDRDCSAIQGAFGEVFQHPDWFSFYDTMKNHLASAAVQTTLAEQRMNELLPGAVGTEMQTIRQGCQSQQGQMAQVSQQVNANTQQMSAMQEQIGAMQYTQVATSNNLMATLHNIGHAVAPAIQSVGGALSTFGQSIQEALKSQRGHMYVPQAYQWGHNTTSPPAMPTQPFRTPLPAHRSPSVPWASQASGWPSQGPFQVTPTHHSPQMATQRAPTAPSVANTPPVTTPAYPVPDGNYHSIASIMEDWQGTNSSPFAPYGGIGGLESGVVGWRRHMRPGAKKAVQRLAFVAAYVLEWQCKYQEDELEDESNALQRAIEYTQSLVTQDNQPSSLSGAEMRLRAVAKANVATVAFEDSQAGQEAAGAVAV